MKSERRWPRAVAATLAAATAAMLSATADAQTILLDLGNNQSYRGADAPSPDSNGNYWNSVWSGAFYPDLVDTDGNATTIDFGFSSAAGTDYFNGPSGPTQDPSATIYDASALGNLGVNEAVYDFYVTSTFQIQGLDPAKTYNLTFFGSHKYNNDNVTRYTAYTDETFSAPVASVDLEVGVNENHNQDTVVMLSGLAPQANNILYIGFSGANGGDGYLNALEIQAVPEPACALLLASGTLLVCAGRQPRA